MKIQKGMPSLCTKVGRFNDSKAELMQTVSVKIQKKVYQVYVQKDVDSTILGQN